MRWLTALVPTTPTIPHMAVLPQMARADQYTQAVGHRITIGDQHGMPPPDLAVELQELPQDDEHADQHHSTRRAEDETEKAIHAAEDREARVMPRDRPEPCAEEEDERDDDDPRRPRAHVARGEKPAEMRLDHIREMPGHEQRHHPGAERDRFPQKPADGTHDRRHRDDGDHYIIGCVHETGWAPATPRIVQERGGKLRNGFPMRSHRVTHPDQDRKSVV